MNGLLRGFVLFYQEWMLDLVKCFLLITVFLFGCSGSFAAAHRPSPVVASWVTPQLWRVGLLSSCGARASLVAEALGTQTSQRTGQELCMWVSLLQGRWRLPRPGVKPLSPALVGGFSRTIPPGKSNNVYFLKIPGEPNWLTFECYTSPGINLVYYLFTHCWT